MQNGKILIKDYPCGSGKTSKMIEGLSYDKKYLIVVPLLSEVERIISLSHVSFHQPNGDEDNQHRTKYEGLETLLLEGKNIVTSSIQLLSLLLVKGCYLTTTLSSMKCPMFVNLFRINTNAP